MGAFKPLLIVLMLGASWITPPTFAQVKPLASLTTAPNAAVDLSKHQFVKETAHFLIYKINESPLEERETAALIDILENSYTSVQVLLNNFAPQNMPKISILLNGDGMPAGKMPNYPNVDQKTGAITLYRYMGPAPAYSSGLPHELVHAMRLNFIRHHIDDLDDYSKGAGFIEEGFAEYVAQLISPTSMTFPSYGFPLTIATGYWLSTNTDIPLKVLFEKHAINPSCVAQAYPLRASFMRFLDQEYGREKLLNLAYSTEKVSLEMFEQLYGRSFEDLAKQWRSKANQDFQDFPNMPNLLKAYLEKTPIRYFPVCQAGKQW